MRFMALLALIVAAPAFASGDHDDHSHHNSTVISKGKDNTAAGVAAGVILTCLIVSVIRGKACWKGDEQETKKDPEPLKVTPENLKDNNIIFESK